MFSHAYPLALAADEFGPYSSLGLGASIIRYRETIVLGGREPLATTVHPRQRYTVTICDFHSHDTGPSHPPRGVRVSDHGCFGHLEPSWPHANPKPTGDGPDVAAGWCSKGEEISTAFSEDETALVFKHPSLSTHTKVVDF
jgi:hypothetical protein